MRVTMMIGAAFVSGLGLAKSGPVIVEHVTVSTDARHALTFGASFAARVAAQLAPGHVRLLDGARELAVPAHDDSADDARRAAFRARLASRRAMSRG